MVIPRLWLVRNGRSAASSRLDQSHFDLPLSSALPIKHTPLPLLLGLGWTLICDILCCIPLNSWTRDHEFTSGEKAFHSRRELVITSSELELGSCTSSSPLVTRWRRFMMCKVAVNRSFYLFAVFSYDIYF